jgi:hypothetical protein
MTSRTLFAAILACTLTLELSCHFLHRVALVPDLPKLPEVGAGCQTDWVAGYRDCEIKFADGTYIKTRAYGN